MAALKGLVPRLVPFFVVVAVVGTSLLIGSLMGSRQFATSPSLSILSVSKHDGVVEIAVRNNELYPVLGKAWYTLTRPGSTQSASEGQPIIFGPVLPKSTQTVQFPDPRQPDLVFSPQVSEVIPHVDEVTFKSATLQLLNNKDHLSNWQTEIELVNLGTESRLYQVSLYLMRVREENNSLFPTGETYPSDIRDINVGPRQVMVVEFNQELPFSTDSADPYQLLMWIRSNDNKGPSERPIQMTYPDLLRPTRK